MNNRQQRADFGDVARALDLDRDRIDVLEQVSLVERELLWAQAAQGMRIPEYILAALDEAISLDATRRAETLGMVNAGRT